MNTYINIEYQPDRAEFRAQFLNSNGEVLDYKFLSVAEADGLEMLVGLSADEPFEETCASLLSRIDEDNPFDSDDVTYLEQMLRQFA
jgi:hypothetical protein